MLLLPLLFYISCCFQEEDDDRTLTNIRHRLARTGLLNSVFLLSRKKLADQVAPRFDMLPDGQDHEDPQRPKHGHTATFPAAEKQKI